MEKEGDRLENLSSDNKIKCLGGEPSRLLITAGDVIHCWTIPSLFLKIDAIPGRLNQLSFSFPIKRGEVYFGQCRELCGANHRFIPIRVEIL
jgi:cytochrome c oxidase subunit 2